MSPLFPSSPSHTLPSVSTVNLPTAVPLTENELNRVIPVSLSQAAVSHPGEVETAIL